MAGTGETLPDIDLKYLQVELKESSPIKAAAIAGKPSKYYLNGAEFEIVRAFLNKLRDDIDSSVISYKAYTALMSQSAPTVVAASVLQNNIGEIALLRDGVGAYRFSGDGLFPADKRFLPTFSNNNGGRNVFLPIVDAGGIVGYYTMYFATGDDSNCYLETYDQNLNPREFGGSGGATLFVSSNMPIEIRVYN